MHVKQGWKTTTTALGLTTNLSKISRRKGEYLFSLGKDLRPKAPCDTGCRVPCGVARQPDLLLHLRSGLVFQVRDFGFHYQHPVLELEKFQPNIKCLTSTLRRTNSYQKLWGWLLLCSFQLCSWQCTCNLLHPASSHPLLSSLSRLHWSCTYPRSPEESHSWENYWI